MRTATAFLVLSIAIPAAVRAQTPDPMKAAQKARIVDRAGDQHYLAIDRAALLANEQEQVWDYVTYVLGPTAARVQCWMLDEKPVRPDGRVTELGNGGTGAREIVPSKEVEYVDVLRFGQHGLMVRGYTRDFVKRMAGEADALVPLEQIVEGEHVGMCR